MTTAMKFALGFLMLVPVALAQEPPPCPPAPDCPPPVAIERRQIWVEPIYTTVHDAQGVPHRVLVQEGRFATIEIPRPAPPLPPAPIARSSVPVVSRGFPVMNQQRFQVQIESVSVTRPDGSLAEVLLPHDRAVASGHQMLLSLPGDAVAVHVQFKEWDYSNKRFRLPVLGFSCDLAVMPGAAIL